VCCCVVWEGYLLTQLLFTGWSQGLGTDKCAVGRDWRLHWCRLYLINVLSLQFFTIWKANVFLVVFLEGTSVFYEVKALSVSVFLWSSSTSLMELDMYKSVPLVGTPFSYFLFSFTNTVDVQSYEVEAPLVPFDIGFWNVVWYLACSVSKVPYTLSLC
jgi:hypothetical protein